ncbi:peptidoglycan D,D-transpeptidase FtsI family protein [Planctomicrobium sp. SH668]|uniref:peptidoglycan D,D-transpeptidase FtsI family protein n=1 Tax=Planctomicrobium sp. SH668 TaxID=3448126 RepID=UPI003F5C2DE4
MRNQPFSSLNDSTDLISVTTGNPRRRPLILGGVIVLTFAIIGARVTYIQMSLSEEYIAPWNEIFDETEIIPSRDGRIVSRDGVVLAQDITRYDVAVEYRWLETPPNPRWLRQQISKSLTAAQRKDPELRAEAEQVVVAARASMISNLARLTHRNEVDVQQRIASIQKTIETMLSSVERKREERKASHQENEISWSEGFTGIWKIVIDELTTAPERFADDPIIIKEELQDHVVLADVPLDVVAQIQSHPASYPGVRIRSSTTRTYPQKSLAAHVIGVRKAKPQTDEPTDIPKREGESGIERSHSSRISGTPGKIHFQRNRHFERGETESTEPAVDGQDVILTIDSRIQRVAEELLDAAVTPGAQYIEQQGLAPRGATLIAMDIWSGDIIAMASAPRPSLEVLVQPSVEEWKQLQEDPRKPLFQRPTQVAIAPGSLFKLITAMAAIEEQESQPGEIFLCRGYLDEPDQNRCQLFRQYGIGHNELTLPQAIEQSCNVIFYDLGRRLGRPTLQNWVLKFGFGSPTGIDLPRENAGSIPEFTDQRNKNSNSAVLQFAIGQGPLLVSPLQVVRMMAAIANGGYLVNSHLTLASPGEPDTSRAAPRRIERLSAQTLEIIRAGMELAVESPDGNAHSARIEMMPMAGMTALSPAGVNPEHVWYAGYAPATNPRVAIVVLLEHGGSGHAVGPIVHDFVTELLGLGFLVPRTSD